MKTARTFFLYLSLIIALNACDEGLAPPDPEKPTDAFLKGKVTFTGAWPARDSVNDLRVVAFRNYPPNDIVTELFSGNAFFTDAMLDTFVTETEYTMTITEIPFEINYLVVALQWGDDFMTDWMAVGVYSTTGNAEEPSQINVNEAIEYPELNIYVDFDNLPPQPF